MDSSRTGTLTLGEAHAAVRLLGNGDPGTDRSRWPALGRVIFEAREAIWERTRSSPTLAAIVAELAPAAAQAKVIGARSAPHPDDANASFATVVLLDYARSGELTDLGREPYVRFFDHEGDVAGNLRLPLDLSGPAAAAVRRLVFHFNQAGNDNHWPLWSGIATSRYRLGVEESEGIVARIRQEPLPRRRELFAAAVAWLDQDPNSPGLLYLDEPARPLFEALAIELDHPKRFPPGTRAAPAIGQL